MTDRDRVVAELGPPRKDRSPRATDAIWDEMVREGIITPAAAPTGKPPPRKPLVPFDQLMKELDEDREDR